MGNWLSISGRPGCVLLPRVRFDVPMSCEAQELAQRSSGRMDGPSFDCDFVPSCPSQLLPSQNPIFPPFSEEYASKRSCVPLRGISSVTNFAKHPAFEAPFPIPARSPIKSRHTETSYQSHLVLNGLVAANGRHVLRHDGRSSVRSRTSNSNVALAEVSGS